MGCFGTHGSQGWVCKECPVKNSCKRATRRQEQRAATRTATKKAEKRAEKAARFKELIKHYLKQAPGWQSTTRVNMGLGNYGSKYHQVKRALHELETQGLVHRMRTTKGVYWRIAR